MCHYSNYSESLVPLFKNRLDAGLKRDLSRLDDGTASKALTEFSLHFLSMAVSAVTGKKAIILIDEYDVPLATAQKYGYYDKMLSFMRCLLGNALKDNESLKFCLMTGCLRIAKESAYTGLNNLKCYSIFLMMQGFPTDRTKYVPGMMATALAVRKECTVPGMSCSINELMSYCHSSNIESGRL